MNFSEETKMVHASLTHYYIHDVTDHCWMVSVCRIPNYLVLRHFALASELCETALHPLPFLVVSLTFVQISQLKIKKKIYRIAVSLSVGYTMSHFKINLNFGSIMMNAKSNCCKGDFST